MQVSLKKMQKAREDIELEMPDDTIIRIKPILSLELVLGFEALRAALDSGVQFIDDELVPGRKISQVEIILRSFMDVSQWEPFYQSCRNKDNPVDFRDLSSIISTIFDMKTGAVDAPKSDGLGSFTPELLTGGQSTQNSSNGASPEESTEHVSLIG